MSSISRWSYTSTARVKPFVTMNMVTGMVTYGTEYDILCSFISESNQSRSVDGAEFVSKHTVFTEDARPKYLDMIRLPEETEWEEIRARTKFDMSMFNDSPDFKLITG